MAEILLLLACNILLPTFFVWRHCIVQGKVEFNHVLLFTTGYLVYWILPFVIGQGRLLMDAGGMQFWYSAYDRVPSSAVVLYLLMSLSVYVAFAAGIEVCRRLLPGSRMVIRPFFFDRRLLNIFLALGLAAVSVYVVLLRNDFFKGYTAGDLGTNLGPRGSFIAVSVFLLSLAILYSVKLQETQTGLSFRRAVSHHFFACYLVVAVLALSLGGRLYFVSSVLMLLTYRTVYFQKIGYRALLLFVLVALVLAGTIGTLRLGVGSLAVGDIVSNLVSEPLFNSFSLLEFLVDGRFDLVNAPIFLLGDFVNLAPSALFPGKASFLIDPEEYGFRVFSPLGSLSSFFSFMINFGLFGSMLFMFCMAFTLQRLRSRGRSVLSRTIYIMVCGWIPTTFFRDPFSISLVKSIFQYSILFPTIVVLSASLATFWLVAAPRRAALK